MIWHVQNENFILDSTRIFMKAFHLLLFNGSFIFPECILIFGLILLLMIDSTSTSFLFSRGQRCGTELSNPLFLVGSPGNQLPSLGAFESQLNNTIGVKGTCYEKHHTYFNLMVLKQFEN